HGALAKLDPSRIRVRVLYPDVRARTLVRECLGEEYVFECVMDSAWLERRVWDLTLNKNPKHARRQARVPDNEHVHKTQYKGPPKKHDALIEIARHEENHAVHLNRSQTRPLRLNSQI